MEKQLLEPYFQNKIRIRLNLKNGKFLTGVILQLSESSLVFLDKFNEQIPISLESISYILKDGE